MSKLSNYLEENLLNLLYNNDAFTALASVYIGLFTSDPTDAGSGTEVSGGSYARVRIYANGGGTPDFALAAVDGVGYEVVNTDAVTFPTATAAWGTITHFALFDASTSGNLLHHGALDEEQAVGTGGIFTIPAGNLSLRLE